MKRNNTAGKGRGINRAGEGVLRLSEITGIENYCHQDISQRKSYCKKLSKHVTAFDYTDKVLIVLSAKSGGVSINYFICK